MRPMVTGAGAGRGHLMDNQSLVPAAQELWNAWEIHFMILLSLFLQVFLFLFAGLRKQCSNKFLRTVLWLAYLSADTVAVFVLGHLAIRVREPGHELMAFWAPFVLVHLGGQDTITAFSKQDNELWRRHLLNLVLQAAVAGYVVAKASWPDTRLRTAMVLMFVSGFFKYAERVFCLGFSDPETLRLTNKNRLRFDLKFQKKKLKEGERRVHEHKVTPDMLMKKFSSAKRLIELLGEVNGIAIELIATDAPTNKAHNIVVAADGDLQVQLQVLLSSENRYSAYEYVGAILENCYRRLHTKEPFRYTIWFLFHPLTTIIADSISLALFRAAVNKAGDQLHTSSSSSTLRVDIMVTYVLLVGAIALDVSSITSFIFELLSFYLPCRLPKPNCIMKGQWSQKLNQYNIISIAGILDIWQWIGLACDVYSKPVTKDDTTIKEFILDTLLASGTRKEWSIASTRGQLVLHKWQKRHHSAHFDTTTTLKSLKETIASRTDFPTSVLVLHIATDICYHFGGINSSDHGEAVKKHKQTSTELSNYIMYLVFKCGVMLTINSKIAHDNAREEIDEYLLQPPKICCRVDQRKDKCAVVMNLFMAVKEKQQDSMGEIKIRHQESEQQQDPTTEIKNQESEEQQDSTIEIENQESTDVDDDNAADEDHIKKLQRNSKTLESPVLPRAVAVAQELIGIENEAERWELIAKVWAEMLYYIAPRCGGDFHYEHLSTGGEFVTHVLLLMYYLGPFMPPPS